MIRAASILNGDATKLVSPSEGTFMCRIIVAEVAYAYSTSNEGLCTFLFPCQRDAATAERVGRSTRLLLCNRPFMSIASQTDLTIRGVLVAGAMMQVPLRDSYLFMDEEADNTTNVSMSSQRLAGSHWLCLGYLSYRSLRQPLLAQIGPIFLRYVPYHTCRREV